MATSVILGKKRPTQQVQPANGGVGEECDISSSMETEAAEDKSERQGQSDPGLEPRFRGERMVRGEVSLSVRSRSVSGVRYRCRCPWGQDIVASQISDQQRGNESNERRGLGGPV